MAVGGLAWQKQLDQRAARVGRHGNGEFHAEPGELGGAIGGRDSPFGELAPALTAHLGGETYRLSPNPTVRLQEISDAADGVRGASREIAQPVTVVVHSETPVRPRHELWNPDRPRVRSLDAQGIDSRLPAEHQVVLQLTAEELRAFRVIERERGEGIDHPVGPDIAAVSGLHADDAYDDLLGHAEFARGARKGLGVAVPELHPRFDALGVDEYRSVSLPGRERGFGGLLHRLDDRGLKLRLAEDAVELPAGEAMLLHHFGDELLHFPAVRVTRRICACGRADLQGEGRSHEEPVSGLQGLNSRTKCFSRAIERVSGPGP